MVAAPQTSSLQMSSDFAREVHRAIFGHVQRPNKALAEGRLVLRFEPGLARPPCQAHASCSQRDWRDTPKAY